MNPVRLVWSGSYLTYYSSIGGSGSLQAGVCISALQSAQLSIDAGTTSPSSIKCGVWCSSHLIRNCEPSSEYLNDVGLVGYISSSKSTLAKSTVLITPYLKSCGYMCDIISFFTKIIIFNLVRQ